MAPFYSRVGSMAHCCVTNYCELLDTKLCSSFVRSCIKFVVPGKDVGNILPRSMNADAYDAYRAGKVLLNSQATYSDFHHAGAIVSVVRRNGTAGRYGVSGTYDVSHVMLYTHLPGVLAGVNNHNILRQRIIHGNWIYGLFRLNAVDFLPDGRFDFIPGDEGDSYYMYADRSYL